MRPRSAGSADRIPAPHSGSPMAAFSAAHLRALGRGATHGAWPRSTRLPAFYAHFDVVKEGEDATARASPSGSAIRSELRIGRGAGSAQDAGARGWIGGGRDVRVLRAPCMGRCDTAPTLETRTQSYRPCDRCKRYKPRRLPPRTSHAQDAGL